MVDRALRAVAIVDHKAKALRGQTRLCPDQRLCGGVGQNAFGGGIAGDRRAGEVEAAGVADVLRDLRGQSGEADKTGRQRVGADRAGQQKREGEALHSRSSPARDTQALWPR